MLLVACNEVEVSEEGEIELTQEEVNSVVEVAAQNVKEKELLASIFEEKYGVHLEDLFVSGNDISINMKYGNLNEDEIKQLASEVAYDIQLQNIGKGVRFALYQPTIDKYGKEDYNLGMEMEVSAETLAKINFGNFNIQDIDEVAEKYVLYNH